EPGDDNGRRPNRRGISWMARVPRREEQGQRVQEMVKTREVSKTGASFLTRYNPKIGNVVHLDLPMPLSLRAHGHAEAAYSTYALVRRVRAPDPERGVVAGGFFGAPPPRQEQPPPASAFNVVYQWGCHRPALAARRSRGNGSSAIPERVVGRNWGIAGND